MSNISHNLASWDSRVTGNPKKLDFSIFTAKMVIFAIFYMRGACIKIKELVGHGALRIDPIKLLTSKILVANHLKQRNRTGEIGE